MQELQGIGVCPGKVIGPAVRMPEPLAEPPRTCITDPAGQADRLGPAMSGVAHHLESLAERATGQLADVLSATAMMANDPALLSDAVTLVRSQALTAERAVWEAFATYRRQLSQAGGYLAERVADLDDVRNRVIARLLNVAPPVVPRLEQPYILVARDLAPADTAGLDPEMVLGFVTEEGGPTSHTAILAKALGTPAVVACAQAHTIGEGQSLLLDGALGRVVIEPDASVRASLRGATHRRKAAEPLPSGAGRTVDGLEVQLLANVGDPTEAVTAAAAGAQGVGLLRTEFLFLGHTEAPSVSEQAQHYQAVFAAFPGRKVVVRTLDAGADKPLPFLNARQEVNPALGVRGFRLVDTHAQVLTDQLRAIAVAADQADADVHVMAPMVATAEESATFVAMAQEAGLTRAGVMVEVPSAVLLADEICAEVSFLSLGTNDLAQYTYAADRLLAPLALLNDFWQPALGRLVRLACGSAERHGRPVGVCGEAASDPAYAAVLVGLGVRSLSMAPACLGIVNDVLQRVTGEQCRQAAQAALDAPSAAVARAQVQNCLGELLG